MKKAILFLAIIFSISFSLQAQTVADTTLHGTLVSKAPDATSVTYLWTQVSGPTASAIVSPTSLVTNVTGLTVGVYTYQLVGTDNFGVVSLPKQVTVTVIRLATAPVVDAGANITIQL